ncbi:MAG TPA: hypothetical protein VFP46_01365 [Candidatus Paceibacterota bacterium]|nr:hypothetical protein [Candidatus Paceibacterota bacterium]
MSPDQITALILEYRYWILIPLSVIEGPIVAFVAGTLAAAGVFNLYALGLFFFARDMIMDSIYYSIGYFGGGTGIAHRLMHKIGITEDHLTRVHDLWTRRPGWTMLFGKISYGIASAFIVVAGMVKMPLSKFFGYGSLVAILQYWSLILAGFFLGASMGGTIERILSRVQYIVLFASIAAMAYYAFSFRMRKRFLESEELK